MAAGSTLLPLAAQPLLRQAQLPTLAEVTASPSSLLPSRWQRTPVSLQTKHLASESTAGTCENPRCSHPGKRGLGKVLLPGQGAGHPPCHLPAWWMKPSIFMESDGCGANTDFVLLLTPCWLPLSLLFLPVFVSARVGFLLLQVTCWQTSISALASCPHELTVSAQGR